MYQMAGKAWANGELKRAQCSSWELMGAQGDMDSNLALSLRKRKGITLGPIWGLTVTLHNCDGKDEKRTIRLLFFNGFYSRVTEIKP